MNVARKYHLTLIRLAKRIGVPLLFALVGVLSLPLVSSRNLAPSPQYPVKAMLSFQLSPNVLRFAWGVGDLGPEWQGIGRLKWTVQRIYL